MWQLEHECELIDLAQGYMIARFYQKEDYIKVMEGGPWIVLGHYLTIAKWRPNFVLGEHEVNSMIIWVRFPTFPVE